MLKKLVISLLLAVGAGFINQPEFTSAVEGSFVVGVVQNLFTTFSGITI